MPTETVTVLFTDLVGSTALSAQLGPDAADELRRAHFGLLRGATADTSGTVVKNLGDGLMVVFTSPSQALACAVAMQRAIDRHNRRGGGAPLAIRVGISAGEVVVEDEDYFGEPVVEASRLVAKATGGQILLTDVVRVMTRGRGHEIAPLGEFALKGLPEPVPTCELRWEAAAPDAVPIPLQPRVATAPTVGFVGRATEREALAAAAKEALAGEQQRVVLLSGEGGIGKTTLTCECARAAHADGAVVLFGRCDEELGVPYQPVVEALHHYAVHAPDEWLARHDPHALGELARAVPAIAKRVPDLPSRRADGGETDIYLFFGAVSSVLADLAVVAPVVLVFDDIHWADRSTLQLLRVLAGGALGRVLILGTFRDNELSAGHPLAETLAELRRESSVQRVSLTGLSDQEVLAFMESAAGHGMDDAGLELGHAILRETDGNPFFVREILLHLVETRAIVQEDGRWVATSQLRESGLPESVREVVGARVARLGSEAAAVLAAASVIGQEFDLDLLCAMTELSEDSALETLEAARQGALVVESASAVGKFQFAHALIQRTIYEDLGPTRQARLHQRAADELESLGTQATGERVAELARHFLAATRPAQAQKASAYARLAGDRAFAGVSFDEAIRWYTEALDALGPDGDPRDRARCLTGLGQAQQRASLPEFRATLFEASRLAQQVGDRELIVRAALANNRGFFGQTGVVNDELVAVLEAALVAIGSEPSIERARLLAALAGEHSFHPDVSRRVALAEDAITAARETGDPATVYAALVAAYYPMGIPELAERRLEISREAALIADELAETDPFAYCFSYYWLAAALLELGRLEGVDEALDRFAQLLGSYPSIQSRWGMGNLAAWRNMVSGDLAAAEDGANRAFEAATESQQPEALSFYAGQLFVIRWYQGRMGELLPLLREAAEAAEGIPAMLAAAALGEAIAGDRDRARKAVAEATRTGFDVPYEANWLTAMICWSHAVAEVGDADAATILVERLTPFPHLMQMVGIVAAPGVALALGRLAVVLGRDDEADSFFARALEIHERLEAPFFIALTKVSWAAALTARDRPRAAVLAQQALEVAQTYGFGDVERRAQQVVSGRSG